MTAFVVVLALFLGGCCRGPDPAAPPIDLGFITAVVSAILARRGLRPRGGNAVTREQAHVDRHKVFFAARRTKVMGIAHEALRGPAGLPQLQAIVEAELDQVDALVAELAGTADARGPYYGGPDLDPARPPHLEIGTLATHVRVGDRAATIAEAVAANPPDEAQAKVLAELDLRRQRLNDIAWRAAALDDELWNPATAGSPAPRSLKQLDMLEMIDRRLRSVEHLRYEASSGAEPDALGPRAIRRRWGSPADRIYTSGSLLNALSNTWWDDFLQRRFESPSLPIEEFETLFAGQIVDEAEDARFPFWNPDPYAPLPFEAAETTWYKNFQTGHLDWNLWPGTAILPPRFHTVSGTPVVLNAASQDWRLNEPGTPGERRSYGWIMNPKDVDSFRAADIVTSLFLPAALEWWQRRWLHADGVLSAIHLESLLHAKRRRGELDAAFNQLATRWDLALDDHFGVRGYQSLPNSIMRAGRTEFFDNVTVPLDDLQVGDQVLIETNLIVFAIASWWDYPTMLVTSVDSEPDGEALRPSALRLQGFGTADLDYPSLQYLLASAVGETLRVVQDRIVELVAARLALIASGSPFPLGPLDEIRWDTGRVGSGNEATDFDRRILHRWSPYGDAWDEPGAWWIRINLNEPMWHGAFGTDVAAAVGKLSKSVAWIDANTVLVQSGAGVTPMPVVAGFVPPPGTYEPHDPHQVVFVPLFEPTYDVQGYSPWLVYFKVKHDFGAGEEFPIELRRVQADATWLPQLAPDHGLVRVIRPRLRWE